MLTLEVVELANGRFGVQAIGPLAPDLEAGEFDTRVEAEEWIFLRGEQESGLADPGIMLPGCGQGLR